MILQNEEQLKSSKCEISSQWYRLTALPAHCGTATAVLCSQDLFFRNNNTVVKGPVKYLTITLGICNSLFFFYRYSGTVRHIKIEQDREKGFYMSDTRFFHSLPVSNS